MKRMRIFAVLFSLILLSVPVGAIELEGVYDDVCPLNVSAKIEKGEAESLLSLTVFNATDHPISYMEFSLYLFDKDGRPASDGVSNYFRAYAPDMAFSPLTSKTLSWSLKNFPTASEIRNFRMEKVVFADEKKQEWLAPDTLFSQSFMYAENPKFSDGRYLLNSRRELTLVDYSYSSQSRLWYIWNDGPGWVPFSRDLVAKCQIWAPGAAIKLEINGDPNLYQIQNFHVAASPSAVAFHTYATGKTDSVMPIKTAYAAPAEAAGDANYKIKVNLPVGDVPCNVGLWDYTESAARTWSIWDGTAWVTFSYDRGPICQIWRTGTIYIKLAYPESEAVYALDVKGA